MSAPTDLDGKLRAWLDLMPDEAPDHAIAAVLDATDTTPQERHTRRWPSWRTPMNRSFAALAVAVVVVIVGAALLLRPGIASQVATVPSASVAPPGSPAIALPAPSVALGAVPSQLHGRWMGGNNSFVADGAGSSLNLSADRYVISQSNRGDRVALAGNVGIQADTMRLTTDPSRPDCPAASVGTYAWSLSPSGRILTLTAVQDPCPDREAAIAGTWWQMACKDPGTDCLGALDAGTYESQYIAPFLTSAADWSPKFGAVTYTVPNGWANYSDWPGIFGLTTADQFAATTATRVDPLRDVEVMTHAAAESAAPPCSGDRDPSVPVSAAAIAGALHNHPGLIVGQSSPITIDGHPGVSVDLAVDVGKSGCSTVAGIVEYLIAGGIGQGIDMGERQRLILLDLAPGNVLAIRIYIHHGENFDSFAALAMPIIQSMTFR